MKRDARVRRRNIDHELLAQMRQETLKLGEFIAELLVLFHPRLRLRHTRCVKFSLPNNDATNDFLDKLFHPFLDSMFVEAKSQEAPVAYPVVRPMPTGANNFCVYLEGEGDEFYVPGKIENA
jgi:hypothetical protein